MSVARAVVVVTVASTVACSLILGDQPIPCSSDADCAKLSGARCDLGARQCVAGSGSLAEAGAQDATTPDATPPALPDGAPADAADASAFSLDAAADAPADVATVPDAPMDSATDASTAAIDWSAVRAFLDGLYDPSQSLLREFTGATSYWTANDNALAMRALQYLPTPDTTTSSAIQARLSALEVCGCSDIHGGHNGLINHLIDPIVTKGAQIPLIPNGPCNGRVADLSGGGTCALGGDAASATCAAAGISHEDHPQYGWSADSCSTAACSGGAISQWNASGRGAGYADLIALEILNYRNRGMPTDTLWSDLAGKWDGVGVNDAVTSSQASYATYKAALFKLVGRVLGQPLPPEVDALLVRSQGNSGGFRTTYALDGGFTLDQSGNAETTSYVTLAFQMPTTAL